MSRACVVGAVIALLGLPSAHLTSAALGSGSPRGTRTLTSFDGRTLPARSGALPVSFEINRGQVDHRVAFLAHGRDSTLYITASGMVLATAASAAPHNRPRGASTIKAGNLGRPGRQDSRAVRNQVLRMTFLGSNLHSQITGLHRLPGIVNYYLGNDPHQWHTGVPTYAQVIEHNVYPGVDLLYHSRAGQLEYDWLVRPGADPARITLRIEGSGKLKVDRQGSLHMAPGLEQTRPMVSQLVRGRRVAIAASFRLRGPHAASLALGTYDRHRPLRIDPVIVASQLVYSTYVGGSLLDLGNGIATDSTGDAYVTGTTVSPNFPTSPGAVQPAFSGSYADAFVTRLDPRGQLLYSTYLGGSGYDSGNGIAVGPFGEAWLTGITGSPNFPTTPGAAQPAFGGSYGDAFVVALSPGGGLIYATYLGGTEFDGGFGIALDQSLPYRVYVTGGTQSSNFPVTPDPFQKIYHSGLGRGENAFVTVLDPTRLPFAFGGSIVDVAYSTYLGGSISDFGTGIAVGSNGVAFVTGSTSSPDFPVTPGAFQPAYTSAYNDNAFVAALDPSGSHLLYSTYLGGSHNDDAGQIAVDSNGDAFVAGTTSSPDFPVTPGAFRSTLAGQFNAFVTEISPLGNELIYSTYLGGSGIDAGGALTLDPLGDVWLTGYTTSMDFPRTISSRSFPPTFGAFQFSCPGSPNAGCAFVTGLYLGGGAAPHVFYSTYLGGSGDDGGSGIAFFRSRIYIVGRTGSTDFPTTKGVVQPGYGGGVEDAFVTVLDPFR